MLQSLVLCLKKIVLKSNIVSIGSNNNKFLACADIIHKGYYYMNKTKISCAIVAALALNPAMAQQEKKAKAQIETIQVTATKRTESIQDVPVSVSASNGEALESLGVECFNLSLIHL